MKYFAALVMFLLSFNYALANDESERLTFLYDVIKCPTCHGQSIKDSNADSAIIMRKNVERLVREGASDDEILTKVRSIYGEQSVTIPTTALHNILLWLFPLIVLGVLALGFLRSINSRS